MRDDGGLIIDEPTIDTQQYPESNHRTTLVDHGTQFPAVVAIPPLRPRPSRRDERPGEDRSVPLQNRFRRVCDLSRLTNPGSPAERAKGAPSTDERTVPPVVRPRQGASGAARAPRTREPGSAPVGSPSRYVTTPSTIVAR